MQLQDFKFDRYKVIILLMYGCIDFDKHKDKPLNGRNYSSVDQLLDELRAERFNMTLFASDQALKTTEDFIDQPNKHNLKKAATALRKDLFGG